MHVHGYNGPYQPIQTVADKILEYWIQYFPSNSGKPDPSFGCLIL